MKNRFTILSECIDFDLLVSKGVIPIHFVDWLQIYKWYLDELKSNPKMIAYQFTADRFNYSTTQIRSIVAFMES
jgi:hypothetical protein